jgi:hypothetical protein
VAEQVIKSHNKNWKKNIALKGKGITNKFNGKNFIYNRHQVEECRNKFQQECRNKFQQDNLKSKGCLSQCHWIWEPLKYSVKDELVYNHL